MLGVFSGRMLLLPCMGRGATWFPHLPSADGFKLSETVAKQPGKCSVDAQCRGREAVQKSGLQFHAFHSENE